MSPIYAAAFIPAATFGIILLGAPRTFLFFYLAVLSIYPFLKEYFPTGLVKYLNELMGALLFTMFVVHIALRRLDFSRIRKWTFTAFLFLGYVVFTWALNRGSMRAAVQCTFNYLSFIPFYILCVNYLKRRDFFVILRGSILFFWFNFILNVGWFLHVNPLFNYQLSRNNMVDVAKGTFGACNYVAYFCVMFFFLLLSVLNSGLLAGRKTLRIWIIITLPIILLQLYLTYTNHAYLFFVLAFIPYAAITGFLRKWQSWGAMALLVGAVILAFMVSEELQRQFSKETLQLRQDRLAKSAKVQILNDLAIKNLRTNPMEWVLGVGPGNGMGSIGKANLTPFALKMLLDYYQAFDVRAMQMTSITGLASSAIFTLWGDFGIVGFIIFFLLYVMLFIKCYRAAVGSGENGYKKVLAQFLIGALAVFTLVNIAIDILYFGALTLWLWMWLALFTLPEGTESKDQLAGPPAAEKTSQICPPAFRYRV